MPRTVTLPPSIDYALIIQIAHEVARSREFATGIDCTQAFELAYDAINSHVMRGEVGDNPPRFLWFIGRRAVRSYLANRMQEFSPTEGVSVLAPKSMKPKFATYWLGIPGDIDPIAEANEKLALQQAMAGLDPEQREDLEALATTFDGAAAGKLRGVGRVHFVKRCRQAREAFFRLWYEGETIPSQPKRVVNHVA